jgi:hypothetical protein
MKFTFLKPGSLAMFRNRRALVILVILLKKIGLNCHNLNRILMLDAG